MKTIALTAAALLIASGTAFAGSDHYGSTADQQPAAIDNSTTASVVRSDSNASAETTKSVDGYKTSYEIQPQFRH